MAKKKDQVKENKKKRACIRLEKAMAQIEQRIETQLNYASLTKRKACATAILLMKDLMIRVGNEKSVEENDTYGITTLLTEHATVQGDTVHLSFRGKAGIPWNRSITNTQVAKVITELKNGQQKFLFWYWEDNKRIKLTDTDIRDWLASLRINPKDFRTHRANKLMQEELKKRLAVQKLSRTAARKVVAESFETVAKHLGHLPSTCRTNYVFPELWQYYVDHGGQAIMKMI